MEDDHVLTIHRQWQAQRPDLDPSPILVIGRLTRTARIIEQELDRCFTELGLQSWEFDVLAALRRAGAPYELTPTRLGQTCMISSSAMTNRLNQLERVELVRRRHGGDGDRRSVYVGLTDRGLSLVDRAVAVHLTNEEALLSQLSAEERADLGALLNKLASSARFSRSGADRTVHSG
ncbi:MAG: MarR family transcriptional regulator [Actinobacteria bacterium]|nr:MarR family transcriptional regulator [Actinomycetota bacterium]